MENNAHALLNQIDALDFALVELNLFLDTHPCNTDALHTFQQYKHKRSEKIAEYESRFGPLIRTSKDVDGDKWCWICSPWPWEY